MELKKHQPAFSIEQQIENLKAKGLLIEDDNMAKSFLNEVSYFRFIKAYSLGLKKRNSNYHENVSFNQIVELYLFNQHFRELLFPQFVNFFSHKSKE